MSDLNTTPTPTPTPGPESTPAVTPQTEARESLYARYQQMYQPAPEAHAPEAPSTEPTPPASNPAPAFELPAALAERLTAIEAALAKTTSAPPPATSPAAPPPTQDWVDLLGTLVDTQASAEAKAAAEARLRSKLAVPDPSSLVEAAVQRVRAEQEIREFTQQAQAANPELAPMEPFIAAAVKAKLEQTFAGQSEVSPLAYSEAYKQALTASIEQARKLVLEFRGQGATNASVRTTQILATPALMPQPGTSPRETPPAAPAPESAEDYLHKRAQQQALMRGLVPRQA